MTTIYHNPRCSKSRASLEMLEAKGVNPTIVKYLDTPPSKTELTEILDKLGLQAEQIVRKGEALFGELGLAGKAHLRLLYLFTGREVARILGRIN